MRFRERTLQHEIGAMHSVGTTQSGSPSYDIVQPVITLNEYESIQDTVIKDFFKRRRNGEIFNNEMRKEYIRKFNSDGYSQSRFGSTQQYSTVSGAGYTRYLLDLPGGLTDYSALDTDFANHIDNTILESIARIDKAPYAFMEDVLELRKTIATLRHPIREAGLLMDNFRKSYLSARKQGVSHAKAMAKLWLAARFQFRPIVISIDNAIHAYRERNKTLSNRRSAYSRGNSKRRVTGLAIKSQGVGTNQYFEYNHETEIDIRSGVLYEEQNPTNDFPDLVGLRLKDVPQGLWAVMPMSWVLDRFLNVSGSIQAAVQLSDPDLKVLAPWVKTIQTTKYSWKCVKTEAVGWSTLTHAGDTEVVTTISTHRRPFIPTQQLLPSFTIDTLADFTKDLDLIALVASKALRIKPENLKKYKFT